MCAGWVWRLRAGKPPMHNAVEPCGMGQSRPPGISHAQAGFPVAHCHGAYETAAAMFPDTLHTARLTFRPIVPRDAGPIFDAYAQDPQVTRFLTWKPHQSLADTQAYISHCLATPPHTARTYVLSGRDDHTIRGAMDLRLTGPHRLEFGYALARTHWNQGLMTEALQEVVRWGLAQPPIFRIGAVCDVDNPGSARVMEKAGMVLEGTLRRWAMHPNVSNEPRDCLSYARVR
jgi:[ribosomal protein S5]-alanine N-acetyltransferase